MPKVRWTLEVIRDGIHRYKEENGHLPTAWDFDRCDYLPSARQIQRSLGGLEKLRADLGLDELNYTKGALRQKISFEGTTRGLAAEDLLEPLLIKQFGEPFVHTQKRYYKKLKNRYDFFVYYHGGRFGIDVFSTERKEYIGPNIRHKLTKYAEVPEDIPIYFVVSSSVLLPADVEVGKQSATGLLKLPNIRVVHIETFLELIVSYPALDIPVGFVSAIDAEQK